MAAGASSAAGRARARAASLFLVMGDSVGWVGTRGPGWIATATARALIPPGSRRAHGAHPVTESAMRAKERPRLAAGPSGTAWTGLRALISSQWEQGPGGK